MSTSEGDFEQFNRGQPHLLSGQAEIFQGNLWVTPFADGMVDAAFQWAAHGGLGGREPWLE